MGKRILELKVDKSINIEAKGISKVELSVSDKDGCIKISPKDTKLKICNEKNGKFDSSINHNSLNCGSEFITTILGKDIVYENMFAKGINDVCELICQVKVEDGATKPFSFDIKIIYKKNEDKILNTRTLLKLSNCNIIPVETD